MDFLSFDLETTSAEPATCRVVQVAAILITPYDDGTFDTKDIINEITDPGLQSSDEATAIHGIGPEDWAGKRKDEEVIGELYDWIAANYLDENGKPRFILCGHSVTGFDLAIFYRLAGRPPIYGLPVADTLIAARRLLPLAPSHTLTQKAGADKKGKPHPIGLTEYLDLPMEKAHDAAGDAIMVYRLVRLFIDKEKGLDKTPLEFAAWCAEGRAWAIMPFGVHKGKKLGNFTKRLALGNPLPGLASEYVPSGYAYFICQNFSPDPDLIVTMRTHYNMFMKKAPRN